MFDIIVYSFPHYFICSKGSIPEGVADNKLLLYIYTYCTEIKRKSCNKTWLTCADFFSCPI